MWSSTLYADFFLVAIRWCMAMSLVLKTLNDGFMWFKFFPVYLDIIVISDVVYLSNSCPRFDGNSIDRVLYFACVEISVQWIGLKLWFLTFSHILLTGSLMSFLRTIVVVRVLTVYVWYSMLSFWQIFLDLVKSLNMVQIVGFDLESVLVLLFESEKLDVVVSILPWM